ncbi:hypothetical protein F5887DRAFT_917616 [Amanita rubescens]|nr:hypothetical protein F5887DRAFT_917616 [Amanita rubescens]
MFHRNETQAFMDAKFNTSEDYKFLHQEARKVQGVDKKRKFEIIEHAEARIAQKLGARKARQDKKQENAARIAGIELIMDREAVVKLTGKKLKDQFSAFKTAGAPNMVNMTQRDKVADLRLALQTAIDLCHENKWKPFGEQEDPSEEEEEVTDITGIEGSRGQEITILEWVKICDTIGHRRDVTLPARNRELPTPTTNSVHYDSSWFVRMRRSRYWDVWCWKAEEPAFYARLAP